jgi:hypothetical protein
MENPEQSLFWYIPNIISLLVLGVQDVFFQHCMRGGDRDKRTRLRCFPGSAFQTLSAKCDGKHEHKPWGFDKASGDFSTAAERVYPWILCRRLAARARHAAVACGLWQTLRIAPVPGTPPDPFAPTTIAEVHPERPGNLALMRAAAATQPRGH